MFLQRLKKLDWILFLTTFLLVSLGLFLIYSLSLSQDGQLITFKKQLIFAAIGLGVYFSLSLINYRALKAFSLWLYVGGLLLLAGVLIWGVTIRGTKGWFDLGFFLVQPVEIIKLVAIVFLAKYFTQWARQINHSRHIVLSGLGILMFLGLILLQPDFGSAMVLLLLWLTMLLAIGIKKKHLALILAVLMAGGVLAWFFVLKDYQKDRLMIFLDPQLDPLGRGYNITQSIVAAGSGQLLGRGLGSGSQSQLRFLPESQTDFVFAVLGEELGFAGVSLLLFFFALLFYRLIRAAMIAPDDFGLFLVLGVTLALFVQAFMNMAMNFGLAPVAGISLPLISYGGSYLLTTLAMLGIVQSIIVSSKMFSPAHSM